MKFSELDLGLIIHVILVLFLCAASVIVHTPSAIIKTFCFFEREQVFLSTRCCTFDLLFELI